MVKEEAAIATPNLFDTLRELRGIATVHPSTGTGNDEKIGRIGARIHFGIRMPFICLLSELQEFKM